MEGGNEGTRTYHDKCKKRENKKMTTGMRSRFGTIKERTELASSPFSPLENSARSTL